METILHWSERELNWIIFHEIISFYTEKIKRKKHQPFSKSLQKKCQFPLDVCSVQGGKTGWNEISSQGTQLDSMQRECVCCSYVQTGDHWIEYWLWE